MVACLSQLFCPAVVAFLKWEVRAATFTVAVVDSDDEQKRGGRAPTRSKTLLVPMSDSCNSTFLERKVSTTRPILRDTFGCQESFTTKFEMKFWMKEASLSDMMLWAKQAFILCVVL